MRRRLWGLPLSRLSREGKIEGKKAQVALAELGIDSEAKDRRGRDGDAGGRRGRIR